jgi:hypothetical protein
LLKNTLATLVYIPGAAAMPQFTIPLLTSPQIRSLKGQSQEWCVPFMAIFCTIYSRWSGILYNAVCVTEDLLDAWSSIYLRNYSWYYSLGLPTLQTRSHLCIPRNETAHPRYQFSHSSFCVRDRAISFLGTFVSNFRDSVFAVQDKKI